MGLEGEEAKGITGVMACAQEGVIPAFPKAVREGCSDPVPKPDPTRSFTVPVLRQEKLQTCRMDALVLQGSVCVTPSLARAPLICGSSGLWFSMEMQTVFQHLKSFFFFPSTYTIDLQLHNSK